MNFLNYLTMARIFCSLLGQVGEFNYLEVVRSCSCLQKLWGFFVQRLKYCNRDRFNTPQTAEDGACSKCWNPMKGLKKARTYCDWRLKGFSSETKHKEDDTYTKMPTHKLPHKRGTVILSGGMSTVPISCTSVRKTCWCRAEPCAFVSI